MPAAMCSRKDPWWGQDEAKTTEKRKPSSAPAQCQQMPGQTQTGTHALLHQLSLGKSKLSTAA